MSADSKPRAYTPIRGAIVENVELITGFVALIDVLGFRELVGRDDKLSQVQEYVATVASHLENEKYSRLQFVLFSDNLVVNTMDDKKESFVSVVRACSDVFFNLIQHRIAVRGAVAHGLFMRSPNTKQGVIVAGRPIVEADFYQHCQDWVGIILAPSTVRQRDDLAHETTLVRPLAGETADQWYERAVLGIHIQRCDSIPFHPEGDYDGYAILPMHSNSHTAGDIRDSLRDTSREMQRMKAAAPDLRSQLKYGKTLNWLSNLERRWKSEAQSTDFQLMAGQVV